MGATRVPITSRPEKPTERAKEMIKKHPHLKPAGIQSAFVMSSLQTGQDWEKVEKEATKLLDRKWTGSPIRNKVCAKKFIQVVKILKR